VASLTGLGQFVVFLDDLPPRLIGRVGVDAEPFDAEVMAHRAPNAVVTERRQPLEIIQTGCRVTARHNHT
jgi:hypothetical protein